MYFLTVCVCNTSKSIKGLSGTLWLSIQLVTSGSQQSSLCLGSRSALGLVRLVRCSS